MDDGSTRDATPQIGATACIPTACPLLPPSHRTSASPSRATPASPRPRARSWRSPMPTAARTRTGFITSWAICSTGEFAGVGGHNLLPPDDSAVAAAVMVSPGGPAHVMLNDRAGRAHSRLQHGLLQDARSTAVGGFDPIFRKAGDDVDLCWRLQQAGFKIGFSPAAFVWHYRRSTDRRVFETAARLRRGGGAAGAQTSGVFQRVRRQHLARADLHAVEVRRAAAARRSSITACSAARRFRRSTPPQPALTLMLLHHARISRARHAAAVGAVGDVSRRCCRWPSRAC